MSGERLHPSCERLNEEASAIQQALAFLTEQREAADCDGVALKETLQHSRYEEMARAAVAPAWLCRNTRDHACGLGGLFYSEGDIAHHEYGD